MRKLIINTLIVSAIVSSATLLTVYGVSQIKLNNKEETLKLENNQKQEKASDLENPSDTKTDKAEETKSTNNDDPSNEKYSLPTTDEYTNNSSYANELSEQTIEETQTNLVECQICGVPSDIQVTTEIPNKNYRALICDKCYQTYDEEYFIQVLGL